MRNPAAVGIVLLGCALSAQSQDVGIGMKWNGGTGILIPVKLNENLMLEGSVAYSDSSDTYNGGYFGNSDHTYKEMSYGVGLFWLKPMGDSVRAYLGPRVAYNQYKTTFESSGVRSDSQTNTWSVAPTLGFEYFPVKHLSLGGEVGLSYAHVAGTPDSGSGGLVKAHALSTTSSVLIRYYF
jgi:hypothetical protein